MEGDPPTAIPHALARGRGVLPGMAGIVERLRPKVSRQQFYAITIHKQQNMIICYYPCHLPSWFMSFLKYYMSHSCSQVWSWHAKGWECGWLRDVTAVLGTSPCTMGRRAQNNFRSHWYLVWSSAAITSNHNWSWWPVSANDCFDFKCFFAKLDLDLIFSSSNWGSLSGWNENQWQDSWNNALCCQCKATGWLHKPSLWGPKFQALHGT